MRTNYTDEQLKKMFTKEGTEYGAHQVSEKEGKLKADADGRLHLVE